MNEVKLGMANWLVADDITWRDKERESVAFETREMVTMKEIEISAQLGKYHHV